MGGVIERNERLLVFVASSLDAHVAAAEQPGAAPDTESVDKGARDKSSDSGSQPCREGRGLSCQGRGLVHTKTADFLQAAAAGKVPSAAWGDDRPARDRHGAEDQVMRIDGRRS